MWPRSLSAAAQSVALKPSEAPLGSVDCFVFRFVALFAIVSPRLICHLEMRHLIYQEGLYVSSFSLDYTWVAKERGRVPDPGFLPLLDATSDWTCLS